MHASSGSMPAEAEAAQDLQFLREAIQAQRDAEIVESRRDAAGPLLLAKADRGVPEGFYRISLKGCLADRLKAIGVSKPDQSLNDIQHALRIISRRQIDYFQEKADWRHMQTPHGVFIWGPERPDFSNGATIYVVERDAASVEAKCIDGSLEPQSKHAIVSAEFINLFRGIAEEWREFLDERPGPIPAAGRSRYKEMHTNEIWWYAHPHYEGVRVSCGDMHEHDLLFRLGKSMRFMFS